MISQILKYFPLITENQQDKYKKSIELYQFWNEKINVISRKDIDKIVQNHILHSLAIAKIQAFLPNSEILDVGTGGGFPGIPLAIMFPEVKFHLVDSIGKKIKVVKEISSELDLQNVEAEQIRAEQITKKYDFVVSRAVTQMNDFTPWVKGKFRKEDKHSLKNGILYLKGGDLTQELSGLKNISVFEISEYFSEDFFETKKVVHLCI